ncbi:hypothetical protein D8674_038390 [Pyrus ussuriensis x Pyrus communis]|uniref:Uncharacterized protein n=1 Tax=Pyrus ussuriensis x Pyrus communis TaxID=2448454 RepID=A0A5N5IG83_9ROSA|nr:hypothetical protein D8674_038390 [Pyrus ussuriensis x Pyrus communis]
MQLIGQDKIIIRRASWQSCGLISLTSLYTKIIEKSKEAAAAAAQAAAAAASAASAANVQFASCWMMAHQICLMRSIGGSSDPGIGLHGGALLVLHIESRGELALSPQTAISTIQSMPLSGFGSAGHSSFSTFDDGFSSHRSSSAEAAPQNFQLYSWETFQPVGGLLPQPEWTAWDQTVEYVAFAYQKYIVISSLRPQYRYLGDVAIPYATGAVWHRRQLFVITPTTIDKKEAQSRALAEHGEQLALIAVEGSQSVTQERIALRPPMLQVVRLASFHSACPSVPPFLTLSKQSRNDGDSSGILKEFEERRVNEIAVGGGGVSVAVTRFPTEQKRPVGPLVVVGVRDGVLWLIDRYMSAHALSLSHPGILFRCLAAYGDAVSAVKWASRLGREHHDDLAQFLLGMGYATEALHLPGISKRMPQINSPLPSYNEQQQGYREENTSFDLKDILTVTTKKENVLEAVQGIVKFVKEFMDLIDAADATGQAEIAREALKRLGAAASVKGALQGHELRGQALRLANHGELTQLSNLVNNLISVGSGREAAFAAAVLGDNALMEKAWQETGMLAEAVLHAHAHGRPTLKNLVQTWNKMLQKEVDHTPTTKTDAAAAFLASLEEPKLTSLADAAKKPPIEILPPGMPSLSAPPISMPKKTAPGAQNSLQQPAKPLMLEAAPTPTPAPSGAPQAQQSESGSDDKPPASSSESDPGNPVSAASGESVPVTSTDNGAPLDAPPQAPQSGDPSQEPQSEAASQAPQSEAASQVPQSEASASQAPQSEASASQAPQSEAFPPQAPQSEAPPQSEVPPQSDAPFQAPQPEAPQPAVPTQTTSLQPQVPPIRQSNAPKRLPLDEDFFRM